MSDGGGETGNRRQRVDRDYGDELLCANWNPVIALLEWSCARTAEHTARADSNEVREEDAETFLGRIYTAGT